MKAQKSRRQVSRTGVSPKLQGGVVDLVAPASAVSGPQIKEAFRQVRTLGFEPRFLHNPRPQKTKSGLFSDSDQGRFKDLKRALKAPGSQLIWCLRGGYGSMRLLPFLKRMKKPPGPKKVLTGYSDVSALKVFLNLEWGWPTLHFPVLKDMKQVSPGGRKRFQAVVRKGRPQVFKNLKVLNPSISKRGNTSIVSSLTGGNATVIQTLMGTPYQPSFKNCILFLEEVGEKPYRLDRTLAHLYFAGAFSQVKALVLGPFIPYNQTISRVLREWAGRLKVPVVAGVAAGHGPRSEVLPFATPCELCISSREGKARLTVQSPFNPPGA